MRTPLLIVECPCCNKPGTVETPSTMHLDEHGQVYLYFGCARSQKVLRVMVGRVAPDPHGPQVAT